jgi:hypothetical protein
MSPYVIVYLVENSSKLQFKRFTTYGSVYMEGNTHIVSVKHYMVDGSQSSIMDKTHHFDLQPDEHLTRSFFPLPLTPEHFKCLNFYNSRLITRIDVLGDD